MDTITLAKCTSRILVWIGGSLIILSALLVTVEVVLRKFFNISIGGADELSGYAFGIATSCGMAYALFERAHIRVDVFFNIFPRWLQIIANLFGLILLGGFVAVICFTAWGLVADTLSHNSHSITPMRIPLSVPQIPWLAGWLFFLFCCVLLLVKSLLAFCTGNIETGNRLIGPKSINEQIRDEKV